MSRASTAHAAPTARSWTPALVAVGTLALGYADLARGGATLSALLLIVGYVVAVPWAIMRAGRVAG